MLGKIFQVRNIILKITESIAFKRIATIIGILALILLGLLNVWKNTYKDLQTNTGEILKILVCMDLGFSEEASEKIILNLTEEDNSEIDNILNKYTNGLQIIDRLSELTDFNNIRDILSNEDIDNIQTIYKKYIDKENKYGE